ncbi:hypothetical protein D3C81_1043580 [compost metagenome]
MQRGEHSAGLARLIPLGQRCPGRCIAVQIFTIGEGVHFVGPAIVCHGCRTVAILQNLDHRYACPGKVRDEAVFLAQTRHITDAVVVTLYEELPRRALDDAGGRHGTRAMPQHRASTFKLREAITQPSDLEVADRRPVGWDLVIVEALDAVLGGGHER